MVMDDAFKAWWSDYCKSPLDEKMVVAQDAWKAGIDARFFIMKQALDEIACLGANVEDCTANGIAYEALRKIAQSS